MWELFKNMKSVLQQNVAGTVKFRMILLWRVSGFIKSKYYYKVFGFFSLAKSRSETCKKTVNLQKFSEELLYWKYARNCIRTSRNDNHLQHIFHWKRKRARSVISGWKCKTKRFLFPKLFIRFSFVRYQESLNEK